MSNNTKYQPAPQRDSFEESNYTQAPPSYQAETSGHRDILEGPRSEDDNVPDDFKVRRSSSILQKSLMASEEMAKFKVQFGGSVSEATLPIRMQFVRKVYSIL